jgi:hypothetical protein
MKRLGVIVIVLLITKIIGYEVIGKFDSEVVLVDENHVIGMYSVGTPPKNWNVMKDTSVVVESKIRTTTKTVRSSQVILDVPAYSWSYGCVPTSGAMLSAYYDRNGYDNIYTGPSNNSVMPMTNISWGVFSHTDANGEPEEIHQNPLAASRQGLDSLETRGHVDDYWLYINAGVSNNNHTYNDPWSINEWEQHEANCIADFMGTNQAMWRLADQGTWLRFYSSYPIFDYTAEEGTQLINNIEYNGTRDGIHGLRLFWESRGYEVYLNYNQTLSKIEFIGNSVVYNPDQPFGFTFEEYKHEIDSGRPVFIHVSGHTMLGVGYDDSVCYNNNPDFPKIFIHNTWDNELHYMYWRRSYYGMPHMGASVFHVQPLNVDCGSVKVTFTLRDNWNDGWQNPTPRYPEGYGFPHTNGKNFINFKDFLMAPLRDQSPLTYDFYLQPDTTYYYSYYENDSYGYDNSWSVSTEDGRVLSWGHGLGVDGNTQEMEFYLEESIDFSNPLYPIITSITATDSLVSIKWDPVLLDANGNNISDENVSYNVWLCDDPEFDVLESTIIEVDNTFYNYSREDDEKLRFFRVVARME